MGGVVDEAFYDRETLHVGIPVDRDVVVNGVSYYVTDIGIGWAIPSDRCFVPMPLCEVILCGPIW
jgi:hypothetical protein